MALRSQGAISGLEFLDGIMSWVLRIALAAVILTTGYYFYASWYQSEQLFRGMADGGKYVSPEEFQRYVNNMQLLMKVLQLSVVAIIISGLFRYYSNPEFGGVAVVVGLLLAGGMALVIDNRIFKCTCNISTSLIIIGIFTDRIRSKGF